MITGGTGGIGWRMVERLAEEGASVFFSGRRAELGADVARLTGATGSARIESVSLEDFDHRFAVHVGGAMAQMKHGAALMRAQQQGSIIDIGSIAGHRAGCTGTLGYSAAKAAPIHLSRCAALELGEDTARVNSTTALVVASQVGTDMSKFPSDKHFASWLGLCPGREITGAR